MMTTVATGTNSSIETNLHLFKSSGGGALLYASTELEKLLTANFDQKIGVQIIQNALKVYSSCSLPRIMTSLCDFAFIILPYVWEAMFVSGSIPMGCSQCGCVCSSIGWCPGLLGFPPNVHACRAIDTSEFFFLFVSAVAYLHMDISIRK